MVRDPNRYDVWTNASAGPSPDAAMFRIIRDVSATVAFDVTRALRNEGWLTAMVLTGTPPGPGRN